MAPSEEGSASSSSSSDEENGPPILEDGSRQGNDSKGSEERKREKKTKKEKKKKKVGPASQHAEENPMEKKKKKDKKRKRDASDDEDEEDSKKRRKEEKKKSKAEDAAPLRDVPVKLSEEDYFTRSTDFRVWLKLVKKINFEDLKREDATKQFGKFVADWNAGKLADMFYDGIPLHVRQECVKSAHKWGFMDKLNSKEKWDLETKADSIATATNKAVAGGGKAPPPSSSARGASSQALTEHEEQLLKEQRREQEKAAKKAVRDKAKVVLEELAPKATGREAMIDARKAKGDKLHGAARAAEESRDGLDLGESVVMGGGDDYQAMVARRAQQQQRRQDEKTKKLSEYQQREKEVMEKFMRDMGLQPGTRVTIAPRRPPDG